MSTILDGKKVSNEILNQIKTDMKSIDEAKKNKKLAIFCVGDIFGSLVYSKLKKKRAEEVGMQCEVFSFENDISENEFYNKLLSVCNDTSYAGIIVQHPLPKHINEKRCLNIVPIEKDIDGLSATSFGLLAQMTPKYVPATALGIITLIEKYNINLVGEKVLVIGKSQVVGLPLSVMLLQKGATVTIAHSRTKNLQDEIKNNKIIIVAIGKPEFIKAEWIQDGQILIDAGYNDGNVGDIEKIAYEKSSFYTPVPGGVGPMTIACLLNQTLDAIKNS